MKLDATKLNKVLGKIKKSSNLHAVSFAALPACQVRVTGVAFAATLDTDTQEVFEPFSLHTTELLNVLPKSGMVEITPSQGNGQKAVTIQHSGFSKTLYDLDCGMPYWGDLDFITTFDKVTWNKIKLLGETFTTKPKKRLVESYYSLPVLGCLHITGDPDDVELEAADGFKYAKLTAPNSSERELDINVEAMPLYTFIPKNGVVTLRVSDTHAVFTFTTSNVVCELAVRLTEAQFPEVSNMFFRDDVPYQGAVHISQATLTTAQQLADVHTICITQTETVFLNRGESHKDPTELGIGSNKAYGNWLDSSSVSHLALNVTYLSQAMALTEDDDITFALLGSMERVEYQTPELAIVIMPMLVDHWFESRKQEMVAA